MTRALRTVFSSILAFLSGSSWIAFADDDSNTGQSSVIGNSLNGRAFGIALTFRREAWVTLIDGTDVPASIEDGVFTLSATMDTSEVEPTSGATVSLRDWLGSPFAVTIEDSQRLPGGQVTYKLWRQALDFPSAFKPVCPDEDGLPTYGIILPNRWDIKSGGRFSGGYTFACPSGVLYKCAAAGYNPWYPDRIELHQACSRLLRADYCGDGRSHTREGTHVFFGGDYLGIHPMQLSGSRVFEAAWTADGATCMGIATADGSPITLVKRWLDLWRRHICLIPFCPPSILKAPSPLLSACEHDPDKPNVCADVVEPVHLE